jgi:hypothetical protein
VSKRVFICYRRDDTAAAAGRVYDRLWRLLSKSNVFFDVSTIAGGENFETKIASEIQHSDAVLIFIGQKWLQLDGSGKARIWDSNDYVRAEVRIALQRAAMVLPILVDGAQMPKPKLLPDEIRPIAARNALPLRHESFDDDTEAILDTILGTPTKERPWESKSRWIVRIGYAIAGSLAALIFLLAAALAHLWIVGQPISASIGDNATTAILVAAPTAGGWIGWACESRRRRTQLPAV